VQGALLGRFVAAVAQIQQVTLLPLVGAAAFLGAGYRVPIAAVVFVAEASGRPGFIVPGVLATVVAQLLMGDVSVTPYQIRMRGGHVEQRLRMRVSEAMQERWTPLHIDLPLEGRVDSAFVTSRALSLPVVDDDGKYRGMVRLADVSAVRARQREGERVQDLLVEAPGASAQETLLEAVATMDAAELDSLAVTTPDGMVIGVVTLDDALRLDEIVARSRDAAGGGASRGR
jgi:CBS domain-containing protein